MISLAALAESTWPPADTRRVGPWLIRDGRGGGQRVSAASAVGPWAETDIPEAETAMQDLGQRPLFVLWPEDAALDAALEARGYRRHDPVVVYEGATADLAAVEPPFLSSFPHWPPLGIARALWAEGLLLVAICLFCIFPFYWMVTTSLKTQVVALQDPPAWIFTPTLANYWEVLFEDRVGASLITVGSTMAASTHSRKSPRRCATAPLA